MSRDRIDTIRGFSCLLLVMSHSIIQVDDISGRSLGWINELNFALSDVRMPLFAFVSGLVYSFSPAFMVGRRTFLARKFERLAIPLLTMTLVMFILKAIVPGARTETNLADLPAMLWFGYSHLWFLQSMLLVFLLIGVLGKSLADLRSRSVLLLVAIVLALTPLQHVEGFSFGGAIRLLPFFVLGTIVHLAIVSYRAAGGGGTELPAVVDVQRDRRGRQRGPAGVPPDAALPADADHRTIFDDRLSAAWDLHFDRRTADRGTAAPARRPADLLGPARPDRRADCTRALVSQRAVAVRAGQAALPQRVAGPQIPGTARVAVSIADVRSEVLPA
jgi:hypothetical protein